MVQVPQQDQELAPSLYMATQGRQVLNLLQNARSQPSKATTYFPPWLCWWSSNDYRRFLTNDNPLQYTANQELFPRVDTDMKFSDVRNYYVDAVVIQFIMKSLVLAVYITSSVVIATLLLTALRSREDKVQCLDGHHVAFCV
jgi:hypothetical protein